MDELQSIEINRDKTNLTKYGYIAFCLKNGKKYLFSNYVSSIKTSVKRTQEIVNLLNTFIKNDNTTKVTNEYEQIETEKQMKQIEM